MSTGIFLSHPKKWRSCNSTYDKAKREGLLKPKPCEVCGEPKVDGHHEDYLKPLEVTWLCRKCHRRRHSVINKEAYNRWWLKVTTKTHKR